LSPQARKARVFSALLQLCVRLSQQRPLVLEVENLHWIDATSEDWLKVLVDSLSSHSMLLLMTCRPEYRPDWLDAACVTALSLSGLNPQQSRQLLQAVPLASQVPEPLARQLLAKADGNPLFLEELTRAMGEHPSDSMPLIPDHVQAVLAARMDRLPTSEKHLLQVAAIIGKDVPLPLLEGAVALPGPVLQQSLQHLRTVGFLYETLFSPDLVYTFKHALTQDVAYQSLLLSTRQLYHYQIAQLLLERFPSMASRQPELVAHHYTEAGHFDESLPYWQRAGEQAVARSANLEAIHHLTKGLEVLTHLPVTTQRNQHELRLQLALSAPLLMTRGASVLGPVSQRILALCHELEDKTPYVSGLVSMWRFLFNMGQFQKARELAEQCFALVQHATDPGILLEVHTMLGSTFFRLGELCTAHVHFQHGASLEATQPPTQMGSQAVDTGVVCLGRQAQMLWHLGYADRALTTIDRALGRAQTTRHAFSLVFAHFHGGLIHHYRREIDALHEDAEAVIALSRAHEFAYYILAGQCLQGVALAAEGAPEAGLAKLQEALAIWQPRGPMGLSALYTNLASLYHQCGQIEAGLQVLDEALTFVHTRAECYYEPEVYRLRGELLLHPSIQDAEQAGACFQHARDIAARQQAKAWELRATMSLCRLWHQQGRHQAARCLLELVYNWFTEGFSTLDLLEARALLEVLRGS
jgi:predicted ATPase